MIGSALSRREAILLAGSSGLVMALPRTVEAAPKDLLFNVFRSGSMIGTHAIRFEGDEGRLQVTNDLELAIKIAFITAYRYKQVGVDQWDNDVLVQTRIQTNDDGKETLVAAEARGDELAVQGPNGTYTTPIGAMTDLSFWNRAITQGKPVIDSQTGDLIKIEVSPSSNERIEVLGRMIDAARFPMAGTKGRSGTVWYDAAGNLVKAVVITRGETLSCELAA